jgi:hypothetical protein
LGFRGTRLAGCRGQELAGRVEISVISATMIYTALNSLVTRHIRTIEMIGVLMRIFSFTLVSWFGPASPFLFVWIFNTVDAVMLSWCSALKRDRAYTVLNVFWVIIGIIGIARAGNFLASPGGPG